MNFLDAYEIKILFTDCFDRRYSWYEKSLFFSCLILCSFLLCLLPFGFFLFIFLLPYLLLVEKKVLLSQTKDTKLSKKDFFPSVRRYFRAFCIFLVKLIGSIFVFPLLSLSFTSYILSECEDLDFKGVLLLSGTISKGNRKKLFCYAVFLFAVASLSMIVTTLILLLFQSFVNFGARIWWICEIFALLMTVSCVCIPLWRKLIERTYLNSKFLHRKDI